MPNVRRRTPEVADSENILSKFKNEIAEELGIHDYENVDKGELPARIHGKIGGNMVKRMIMFAENEMKKNGGKIPPQGDLNTVMPNSSQLS